MKTFAALVLLTAAAGVLLTPARGHAQGASAVIDQTLIDLTSSNHNALMTLLQQQLDEAVRQTDRLQQQLDRMGDPAAVSLPGLDLIKQDIAKSQQLAMESAQKEARLRAITGAEAFGDHAFGLIKEVTSTFKLEDGTEKERDPEKYKLSGALQSQLTELEKVAQQTSERKTALTQQYQAELDALLAATDIATTVKQEALLNVLTGQIQECDMAYLRAKAEYEALETQLRLSNQVASTAKMEEKSGQYKADKEVTDPAELSKEAKKAFAAPGRLPWGKGTSSTPAAPPPSTDE